MLQGIKLCWGEWDPKSIKVFWFTIGDRHDPEPRVVKSSGCNNRSKDDHSFLKKSRFFCVEIFSSRQFRRIVYSFEIIQNLCFSRILKINFTKTCMHACKILQVLPKIQKIPKGHHRCKSQQDSHFPKITFGGQKSLRASRARARARTHTHTRYIY